jgi:DNA (cytosine-5)-methyltransferase 1
MYGRLDFARPAQTITTGFGSPGQGRYLHPSELRTLTPHEAARIQFFPDWFDFSPLEHRNALSRAIGNAVPPKLAFVLASHALALEASISAREDDSATGLVLAAGG